MLIHKIKFVFTTISLLVVLNSSADTIELVDDIGRTVILSVPANRIISLAPHITENLYAAGAGDLIVGVVSYSDYPEQAKQIPEIGTYNNLNIELILASQPDLIIAWKEGNQKQQIEQLISLGLTVYINAPDEIEDIARSIEHFGILTGKEDRANDTSNKFKQRLRQLRVRYSDKEKISVFYQTWHSPLLTVNDQQFIGRIMKLCSGKNIFAELSTLTAQVSVESVLARNPRVIITSGMGEARPDWLDDWKKWSFLDAVKMDGLFFIPPDIIQRHSPRLLDGAQRICEFLQQIRDNKT
ncbi:MAG: iron complex transport system substrate-binding protein [Planctomycetota bacterium]|jgi:iron complex transport system substrate-binding protein